MNTDDPHLKCHLMSQIILHICPHHHVVVLKLRCRRSCHNANKNLRNYGMCRGGGGFHHVGVCQVLAALAPPPFEVERKCHSLVWPGESVTILMFPREKSVPRRNSERVRRAWSPQIKFTSRAAAREEAKWTIQGEVSAGRRVPMSTLTR